MGCAQSQPLNEPQCPELASAPPQRPPLALFATLPRELAALALLWCDAESLIASGAASHALHDLASRSASDARRRITYEPALLRVELSSPIAQLQCLDSLAVRQERLLALLAHGDEVDKRATIAALRAINDSRDASTSTDRVSLCTAVLALRSCCSTLLSDPVPDSTKLWMLQNACHVAAETPLAVRHSGIARFLAAIMRGQLHAPSMQCDAKLTALSILPSLVQQKLRRDVATDSIDALLDSGMVVALVQSAATANTDAAGEDRVSTSIRTLCQLCLCTLGATVNGAAALVGDVGDEDGGDGNDDGCGFALVQELLVGPAVNSEVYASVSNPEHPSVYEKVAVRALTDICLLWPEAKRLATPACVAKLVSMIATDADAASRVHALTALINLSAGHTSREHAELLPPAHVWLLPQAPGADSTTPCRKTLIEHGRVECAAGSIVAAGALMSLLELLASDDLPMAEVHLCVLTLCNLVRWSKRAAEFIAAADFSVALFTRLLFETAGDASESSTKLVLVNVISMSFVTDHQLSELEAAGAEPLMELCAHDEVSPRCPRLLRNESTSLLCASSCPLGHLPRAPKCRTPPQDTSGPDGICTRSARAEPPQETAESLPSRVSRQQRRSLRRARRIGLGLELGPR